MNRRVRLTVRLGGIELIDRYEHNRVAWVHKSKSPNDVVCLNQQRFGNRQHKCLRGLEVDD